MDHSRLPTPQALTAVDRYSCTGNADAWLESINTLACFYNWSDEVCLCVAKIRVTGAAQRKVLPPQVQQLL
jgi:hypothetical protein